VHKNMKKAHSAVGAAEQAAGANFGGQVPESDYSRLSPGVCRKIYELLPIGAEFAISRAALMEITGLTDRELRHQIQQERKAGNIILADCSSRGYYRPESTDETVRFIRSMRNRARETAIVADAVEQALLNEIGQEKLEGF